MPIWCYQAYPDWLAQQLSLSTPVPTMPGESEDCLYLDVLTPKEVFDHRHHSSGAAVLVWIHGGGYDVGSKTNNGPGTGLVARSMTSTTSSGIVYVAINYRLGAFGFLGGETLTRSGGTPNAGLHDQRLALNWVKQHIRKFGGDPSRVTVMVRSPTWTVVEYFINHSFRVLGRVRWRLKYRPSDRSKITRPLKSPFQPSHPPESGRSAFSVRVAAQRPTGHLP